jgi:twitching motility protein PilT
MAALAANGQGKLGHVDEYLTVGQQGGASDIHLGVNAPPLWRLHGILQPIWPGAA